MTQEIRVEIDGYGEPGAELRGFIVLLNDEKRIACGEVEFHPLEEEFGGIQKKPAPSFCLSTKGAVALFDALASHGCERHYTTVSDGLKTKRIQTLERTIREQFDQLTELQKTNDHLFSELMTAQKELDRVAQG